MNGWNAIYKRDGIVTDKPSEEARRAIEFFKRMRLERVLDLGCGTGRHTRILKDEGFDVFACDSSEKAIEISKRKIKGVSFKICDMVSLPYDDDFFDGVFCHHVLQHGETEGIKLAIGEIFRVLRKGAILFLRVVSTEHYKSSTGTEIEPNTRIGTDGLDGEVPHHFFTEDETKEFFKAFRIIRLYHVMDDSEINRGKASGSWILYAKK